jgi:hypothetical protein
MKAAQAIRIGVLLAVIFAAGVFTGRWTGQKPRTLVLQPGGRVATSDEALARMTARLSLDPEQQRQFAPLLEELAGELARHLPATQERLEVFRRYFPRAAALLRPEQKPAFDRFVADTEAKMNRLIRNRNRRLGTTNSDAGLPPPAN